MPKTRKKTLFGLDKEVIYTICILGRYGSGKSLFMTELALELAESRKLSIVANYQISSSAIRKYADAFGYSWLKHVRVRFIPDLEKLFAQKESVILLDEAGTKIFARDYGKIPGGFFRLYNQIRKGGNYFIFAAQTIEQVDYQVEQLIETYIECESFQVVDRQTKRAKMIERYIWAFDKGGFAKNRTVLRRYNFFKRFVDARGRRFSRNIQIARLYNYFSEFCRFLHFYLDYYNKPVFRSKVHHLHKIVDILPSGQTQPCNRALPPRFVWRLFWAKYYRPIKEDFIFKIYSSFLFADDDGKVYSDPMSIYTLQEYEAYLLRKGLVKPTDSSELVFSDADFALPANGNGKNLPITRKTMIGIVLRIAKEARISRDLPNLNQLNDDELLRLYLELTLQGNLKKDKI